MSKRTRDIPPERIDAQLKRSPWCIWPECMELKLHKSMLCHYHVADCAELVYSLRDLPTETVDARTLANESFLDHLNRVPVKPVPPHPKQSYVYIVRVGDLVKIGHTTQPYQRLRAYPPNTEILTVFPGSRKLEAELHGRFRFALRKGREWFRPANEILRYAAEQVERHGPPTRFEDLYRDPGPRPVVGTRHWSGAKKTAA